MMRNDLCWCGSGKKYKKCHLAFDERLKAMKFNIFKGQTRPPKKIINNEMDIEGIRQSGVINDGALDLVAGMIRPGIDTETINAAAHEFIVKNGGIPACLNTDDPAVEGIELPDEYQVAAPAAGLSPEEIRQAQRNGLTLAFLSPEEKQALAAQALTRGA